MGRHSGEEKLLDLFIVRRVASRPNSLRYFSTAWKIQTVALAAPPPVTVQATNKTRTRAEEAKTLVNKLETPLLN